MTPASVNEVPPVFPTPTSRLIRLTSASAVLSVAAILVSLLSLRGAVLPDTIIVHTAIFYGVTVCAYVILPFVRRGDIAVVAMWMVLAAGVAPCFSGAEISAPNMFSDMAGVLMAAAPIYIARLRQVAQGDTRPYLRRDAETHVEGEGEVAVKLAA